MLVAGVIGFLIYSHWGLGIGDWALGIVFRTSPFKVFNENTLFQCYHPELSAQILGFLKVEMTNLCSKFHYLERATLQSIPQSKLQKPETLLK
jgi:hypothetical protein